MLKIFHRLSVGRQDRRSFSTDHTLWDRVDRYFASRDRNQERNRILEQVLENNAKHGMPPIDVSFNQGKLLAMYVSLTKAKRVLEIGTLGAYSTIWIAGALPPGGKITTIEIDPDRAAVALSNLRLAGQADKVEILQGAALDVLDKNASTWSNDPFSFVFIDADKINNLNYFKRALALSQSGSYIVVDNVVRDGKILDESSLDPSVKGVHALCAYLEQKPPRVKTWTAVQTVGSKGWDGYILAEVA